MSCVALTKPDEVSPGEDVGARRLLSLGPDLVIPEEPGAGTMPTIRRRPFPFDPSAAGETRKLARTALRGLESLEQEAEI